MPRGKNEPDLLLHEVATTLRNLSLAVALHEQAVALRYPNVDDYARRVAAFNDRAEEVLAKVVGREGDIFAVPGGPTP